MGAREAIGRKGQKLSAVNPSLKVLLRAIGSASLAPTRPRPTTCDARELQLPVDMP